MLKGISRLAASVGCICVTLMVLVCGSAADAQETRALSNREPASTEVTRPATMPGAIKSGDADGIVPANKPGARISSRLTTRVPSRLQTRLTGSLAPPPQVDAGSQIRAADEQQIRRR